ncbi:MAG TPA: Nudix family hydrolase [Gammaproteobacteria bacterium]|nr:Nudix family hydrolase [Gammaproteobacteria bacterium]
MSGARPLPAIRVAAAVLHDDRGRVLIAQRPSGKPLAGFWEFPGGKLEAGEDAHAALCRELHEELGIRVLEARALMRFSHEYPERRVELEVWRVRRHAGTVQAREHQRLAWVSPGDLANCKLLPADWPITRRLWLPPRMLVTPAPDTDTGIFLDALERSLDAGVEFVQLRAAALDADAFRALAEPVIALCRRYGARVVLNAEPQLAVQMQADGAHLNSRRLMDTAQRPLPAGFLVGASCHDAAELAQAARCGLDYALLGPVQPTASHPGTPVLGWEAFAGLAATASLPVFAIGNMRTQDLEMVRTYGGYGLAAMRGLWPGEAGI